jgi:hypothetical protein
MTDLNQADALARQIVVRYRGEGHVRFAIPAALCDEPYAQVLEDSLRGLEGVYRVTLYRRQGKLSVFYDHHACGLHAVARCLQAALTGPAAKLQRAETIARVTRRLHVARPLQWLKAKREQARARIDGIRSQTSLLSRIAALNLHNQPMLRSMFSEKAVINFFNDLVVFFLIKVHWEMITQKWLKHPVKYRNAWFAMFYLVFLLVRFRKKA